MSAPAPRQLWRCNTCQGTDLEFCYSVWFKSNPPDGVEDFDFTAALVSIDYEGTPWKDSAYCYCNTCEDNVTATLDEGAAP